MYTVVAGTSFDIDVAQPTHHFHGNGCGKNVPRSFCSVRFLAIVNDGPFSLFDWAPSWPEADGEIRPNRSLDRKTRKSSQDSRHRALGVTAYWTAFDVGRCSKCARSMGRSN